MSKVPLPSRRLAEFRAHADLSLEEVAAAANPPTTNQQVGRLEAGQRKLTWEWAERLAPAFSHRRAEDFFADEADEPDGESSRYEGAPMIELKALDARLSAGGGTNIEGHQETGRFGFPADEFGAPADRLYVLTVVGDSMFKPGDPSSLQDGDRVVVDRGMMSPSPPGIFAVFDGMGLVVKCIEPVSGRKNRIRIFSLNPNYTPYEVSASEAHIQGRVRGVWRRM